MLWCRHSKGTFNGEFARYFFERDGTFSDRETGDKKNVSVDEIAATVAGWLTSPKHWETV